MYDIFEQPEKKTFHASLQSVGDIPKINAFHVHAISRDFYYFGLKENTNIHQSFLRHVLITILMHNKCVLFIAMTFR